VEERIEKMHVLKRFVAVKYADGESLLIAKKHVEEFYGKDKRLLSLSVKLYPGAF